MGDFSELSSGGPLARLALGTCGLLLAIAALLWGCRDDKGFRQLAIKIFLWRSLVVIFMLGWMLPYYAAHNGLDALVYHNAGIEIAQVIRDGDWYRLNFVSGTTTIALLVGLVYLPFGGDFVGGSILAAGVGLLGAVAFYKALSPWADAGGRRNYARFLFFLPSFSVWSQLFGKDSVVCCGLGLAAYGHSKCARGATASGIMLSIFGLVVVGAIRPHIAIMIGMAMLMAQVQRSPGYGAGRRRFPAVSLLLCVAALGLLVKNYQSLLDIQRGYVQNNTNGGSAVEGLEIADGSSFLVSLPNGIIRVLFRPFPWEAQNLFAAFAVGENLILLCVVANSLRAPRARMALLMRTSYLFFCSLASALLILLLSMFPNLGTLSRERIQLLPFLLAVLVVPLHRERERGNRSQPSPSLWLATATYLK